MRAARPLTDGERDRLLETDGFPDWDYVPPDEGHPFEHKASDWGWLDGRLVAVDYSTPALFESVDDMSGFRVRLRVRIAKALTSEATSLNVTVMNKEVTITSQKKNEPLKEAKWIVLGARGFSTEEVAQHFGTRLRSIVQLAALSSRLGVDAGEDKPTDWMTENFARTLGLKDHERIAPNIHGLSILPDDDNTRFPIVDLQATVTADPEHLVSALRELGENDEISFEEASNAVRLLNLALMTSEPLAQMVLAFSAVEELGQKNAKWSESQVALIKELADAAETSTKGTAHERAEVADAIRKRLFPLSLRQGVMHLLSRLSLDALRKEWDRLYRIRSGLFHGTARFSDSEINQAARDTITLCGRIILALVANEGKPLLTRDEARRIDTLYSVNPASGALTAVGNSQISYFDTGSTTSGLFAVGTDGNLYSINASTRSSGASDELFIECSKRATDAAHFGLDRSRLCLRGADRVVIFWLAGLRRALAHSLKNGSPDDEPLSARFLNSARAVALQTTNAAHGNCRMRERQYNRYGKHRGYRSNQGHGP